MGTGLANAMKSPKQVLFKRRRFPGCLSFKPLPHLARRLPDRGGTTRTPSGTNRDPSRLEKSGVKYSRISRASISRSAGKVFRPDRDGLANLIHRRTGSRLYYPGSWARIFRCASRPGHTSKRRSRNARARSIRGRGQPFRISVNSSAGRQFARIPSLTSCTRGARPKSLLPLSVFDSQSGSKCARA
jgi:hypothetical protein